MKKYIQVFTTVGSIKEAEKIANVLVKNKLSACVQIFPVNSFYKWKGKTENKKEWMMIIKTEKRLYKKIEKAIKENHSYELPEIIFIPIEKGNTDYLKWVSKQLI